MRRRKSSTPRAWPAFPRARSRAASATRRAPSTICSTTSTMWCCTSRRACSTRSTSVCRFSRDGHADGRVARMAHAYLAFTQEKPRLWNLLFEHHLPAGADLPAWYQQKLEGLMGHVEQALAPHFPAGQGSRPAARRARAVGRRARHHLALDRRQALRGDDRDGRPPDRRSRRHLSRGTSLLATNLSAATGLKAASPRSTHRGFVGPPEVMAIALA